MLRAAQRHAASTEQRPRAGRQIGLKPAQRWACGGNFDTTRVTRLCRRRGGVVQNTYPPPARAYGQPCALPLRNRNPVPLHDDTAAPCRLLQPGERRLSAAESPA